MIQLYVTLHTLGVDLLGRARTKLTHEPERGSEIVEKIVIAVGVIAIAMALIAAIASFVSNNVSRLTF